VTPRAVLVGLPAAGKTTAGRRLAALLGVEFADSDDLVEQRAGRCVPEIFAADGEATFRALEAQVIAAALRDFDGVLSLGGGAVLEPATRAALLSTPAPVVLLSTRVPTLTDRLDRSAGGHVRPLLAGDTAFRLAALAQEREPLYRSVATITVDTERRNARRVAAVIADLLGVPASPS
jgi:shikimate kinase